MQYICRVGVPAPGGWAKMMPAIPSSLSGVNPGGMVG